MDRFANAPHLAVTRSRDWLKEARQLWLRHWLLIPLWALLILACRWQLDFFEGGQLIILSYFTDALFFTWLYLALRPEAETSSLSAAWRAMQDRKWAVIKAGWWGMPAALISFLTATFYPELIFSLVAFFGSTLLGIVALVTLTLTISYMTFLAMLWPILAAIAVARDRDATFKIGGLWAFRSLHAGWRPLLVIFATFITASFLAGMIFIEMLGHFPADFFTNKEQLVSLRYWISWPGLFVAMNAFLALLPAMANDLLRAADHDLSDEIFDASTKDFAGTDFVAGTFDKLGFAMRSVAALGLIMLLVAGTDVIGGKWLALSIFGLLWGGTCYKTAKAWRDGEGKWKRYWFAWMAPVWMSVAGWLTWQIQI